ncbi:MAG: polyphosphate:AMP phosphotransferase [Oceanococcaceae bacterium]
MQWLPAALKEMPKAAWKPAAEALRAELLQLQYRLRQADFPVLLVFGGVDGAGKHETAHMLTEWLDPRFIRTQAYVHPPGSVGGPATLLRYWQDLPAHGRMSVVLSGWYSPVLLARARGLIDEQRMRAQLADIAAFERDLVADGAVVLKIWMHLDESAQRARLGEMMMDPHNVWRVNPRDWAHLHLYDDFIRATDLLQTHSRECALPWMVVDGQPPRARAHAVMSTLVKALSAALNGREIRTDGAVIKPRRRKPLAAAAKPDRAAANVQRRLAALHYPQLDKRRYREQRDVAQAQLTRHARRLLLRERGLVLVFEGWDAAGKGGAIRRLVQALDVRYVKVHRIAAPDAREQAHHYLWRFAHRFPGAGEIAIFDRSWYGRVLVERVEGLAPPIRWQQAYDEINRFEQHWVDAGHHLLKFWLQITPEEQLARFEARREDPLKSWKLTDDDWRNRDKRKEYDAAVNDMIHRTDTASSPWQVIPANDKRYARVAVLDAVNSALTAC